jgi:hypothetical protein
MVTVKGAWQRQAAELGLQTPEKNTMSVVMDGDKFVVSRCSLTRLFG